MSLREKKVFFFNILYSGEDIADILDDMTERIVIIVPGDLSQVYFTSKFLIFVSHSIHSSFLHHETENKSETFRFLCEFQNRFSKFPKFLKSKFVETKELNLCNKFWFSNPYILYPCIFSFIFQPIKSVRSNIKGFHEQVTKILVLENLRFWQILNSFRNPFLNCINK